MRASAVLLMLVALESMGPLSPTARVHAQSSTDDIQDLVYLAADRPVFIRLHIHVLGDGFRGLRAAYAKRLHQSLDADSDGLLNEAEMRNIPPSDQLLPPRAPQEKLRSFNTDPVDADMDGSVTLPELTDYVRKSGGPPFDFKLAPPLHAGQVDLFEVVDENSDGALNGREIQSAAHSILKFDANADEIIDQSELSIDGARHFRSGSIDASAELLSTLLVVDPETDGAAAALFGKFVSRYDRSESFRGPSGDEPSGDGRLNADELGVSRRQFAEWDTNGDGVLDAGEGRRFVLNSVPDLEIAVPLGTEDAATIVQSSLGANVAHAEGLTAAAGPRGDLRLRMGDQLFDLSLGACPAPPADLRREYEEAFVTADGDGNEYLDMTEIRQLGILPAHVPAVDRNGDGMVRKDEALEYVDLQARLFGSRVVLLLSHEPQSTIDLIDEGADDQLGLRELYQAPARLLSWDVNHDGRIAPDERPSSSRLILQNGETMLFRWDQFRSRPSDPAPRAAVGPEWFRQMDRNRDGDVSPAEFLGRREMFSRLDTNSDGLISTSEVRSSD